MDFGFSGAWLPFFTHCMEFVLVFGVWKETANSSMVTYCSGLPKSAAKGRLRSRRCHPLAPFSGLLTATWDPVGGTVDKAETISQDGVDGPKGLSFTVVSSQTVTCQSFSMTAAIAQLCHQSTSTSSS
jgi:hypothetical protein